MQKELKNVALIANAITEYKMLRTAFFISGGQEQREGFPYEMRRLREKAEEAVTEIALMKKIMVCESTAVEIICLVFKNEDTTIFKETMLSDETDEGLKDFLECEKTKLIEMILK